MGRSVDYLSHAEYVAYIDRSSDNEPSCDCCNSTNVTDIQDDDRDDGLNYECNDCQTLFEYYESDAQCNWELFEDSIIELLKERCQSLDFPKHKDRKWDGRETSIIASNNLCEIGISEYCGLVSLSIRVPQDDYSWRIKGLAKNWINKVWPGIEKSITEHFQSSALRRIGGFSDGTSIYESIKPKS